MIALSLVHLVVLGIDASVYFPEWATFQLWSFEHWKPLAAQTPVMLASNAAFWSTLGSFAVPTIMLAGLVLRLDKNRITIPVWVGWAFVAWQLVCGLVMEPAGFVAGLAIGTALLIGLYRGRHFGM